MVELFQPVVPRRAETLVEARLHEEPVIVLEGPRTVGKTRLLQAVAERLSVPIFDLDDTDTRDAVSADPGRYAAASQRPVCLDEYQKAPGVLAEIKAQLNEELAPGRFLLAGSARHDAIPRLAAELTGRYHTIRVYPLSQGEIAGTRERFVEAFVADPQEVVSRAGASATTREEYIERVVAGGFPIALARSGSSRNRWFADMIRASLERDLSDLSKLRQGALLPTFLERLASQTGQVLNVSKVGRETSRQAPLDTKTAESWVRLLEAVFLVDRLPAWGTTLRARAVSKPKLHVVDTGVAAHLMRVNGAHLSRLDPTAQTEFGHLLETFAVWELRKQLSWLDDVAGIGHWRTRDNDEADLVAEMYDGAVVAFEIQAGTSVPGKKLTGLRQLRDALGDRFRGGAVLYLGKRSYTYEDRLHVCPLDRLWTST